jgi:hypothetical protein
MRTQNNPCTPSPQPLSNREADTIRKTRFFYNFDTKSANESLRIIVKKHSISRETASY